MPKKILHSINVNFSGNGGTVSATVSDETKETWPEESFSLSFVGGNAEMLLTVQQLADKVKALKKQGS